MNKKAKQQGVYITIIIIAVLVVLGMLLQKNFGLFAIAGGTEITRSSPTTVNPSTTFTLTYTSTRTGTWGASITDSVTGGCKFPDGTSSYKDVMLSSSGNTRTITITAPSSGSCAFSGDYKFGSESVFTMPSTTVNICVASTCSSLGKQCGSWSNNCGSTLSCGSCSSGQTCTSQGICRTCRTSADTNCDGIVSRDELSVSINQWIAGSITRDQLGEAIQAWITG
jgi:hypothetical protein